MCEPCTRVRVHGKACRLALWMTMSQYWHKLKHPQEQQDKVLTHPRSGGERLFTERLVLEKTRFGETSVEGGGQEPLQMVSVFR